MWRGVSRKRGDQRAPPRFVDGARAARPAAIASDGEHRELAGKGLGRGHADFGARRRSEDDVGFARDGAFRHVDDRQRDLAIGLGIAQRRQRIGGLARLRDERGRAAFGIDRIAIAKFGGDIDFDRQARQLFEPVFADQPGIIGGAAGGDGEPVAFCSASIAPASGEPGRAARDRDNAPAYAPITSGCS